MAIDGAKRTRRRRALIWTSCLASAALALLTLLGWTSGALVSTAERRAMAPLTATAILCAALAILALVPGRRLPTYVGALLALVVLSIGVGVSAEYALGLERGIEHALPLLTPLRPSPPTGVVLAALGAGLLVFDTVTERGQRPAEWVAVVCGLISVMAISGHAYGADRLYEFAHGSVIGVSIPAAFSFLFLSYATLLARPNVGLMRQVTAATPGGRLTRWWAAGAIVVPPLLGLIVNLARYAGLRDLPLTLALLTTLTIPVGVILVFATARAVDRAHRSLVESRESERRLRLELEALESTTRAVIDQMPEGVVVVDREGRLTHINRAGAEFMLPQPLGVDPFGNPRAFDLRRPTGEELPFDEYPIVRALMKRETVVGFELLLRRPDGRLVPVLANASPIDDAGGQPRGAVVVFQDITLLKDVERSREEWTSVVAHDLRQPIGVISLAASFLESLDLDDEEGRKTVARVSRAAGSLERMIRDLLDASRIESRHLTVQTERIELRRALLEVVEHGAPVIGGAHVVTRIADSAGAVEADPGRLAQIVTNLVSNAAKYGEPGSDIVVSAKGIDDHVEIAVTNRGRGLTPEEAGRVFDRYYRTASTSRAREGLGLGLYIVKGLVEAHGGHIQVESVPGKTTTFRFTLPCRARMTEQPLPATPEGAALRH